MSALTLILMAPVDSSPFDLNTLISGGTGAGLMGVLIFAVKLVLDRTIPNRSDARANVGMVLEGLNNMVKVLQEEKIADAKRLTDRQVRIESLESSADKDYDRISELRSEITELRARLAQKERHINTLVQELRKLGARVVGVELDGLADSDIRVITDRLFGGAPTTAPVSTRTGATPLQNS